MIVRPRILSLPGKSLPQKFTDHLKSLIRSVEASHTTKESVDHAFPYIEMSIHFRCDCSIYETDRIVKQYLVISDMNADWTRPFRSAQSGEAIGSHALWRAR